MLMVSMAVSRKSIRWIEGHERTAEQIVLLPCKRVAGVTDHEGDIVALMARAQALGQSADRLTYSRRNRMFDNKERMRQTIQASNVLGKIMFIFPGRGPESAGG